MGTSAGVLLWVLGSLGIFPDGKTYALFFGAWYAFAELIPYIGPAIGAGPPVLIAAVQRRAARRAVADDRVHRAAADRGPHRRAERVRAGAADQPAAGDLRAAARRPGVRLASARSSRCRSPRSCARASTTSARTSRFESWDLPSAADDPGRAAGRAAGRARSAARRAPRTRRRARRAGPSSARRDAEAAAASTAPG